MTDQEIKYGEDMLNLLKEILNSHKFVNMVGNYKNEIGKWLILAENKLTDGMSDSDPLDLFMAMDLIKKSFDQLMINQNYIKAIMFHDAQRIEDDIE